jgi:hypothetical protein
MVLQKKNINDFVKSKHNPCLSMEHSQSNNKSPCH